MSGKGRGCQAYLEHPCIDYPDVVVVICRIFLELLHAGFKVDLFPLVLEHLPIDGALLVFLRAAVSARAHRRIQKNFHRKRDLIYSVAKRQRSDWRWEEGTESRGRPERSRACCDQQAAH